MFICMQQSNYCSANTGTGPPNSSISLRLHLPPPHTHYKHGCWEASQAHVTSTMNSTTQVPRNPNRPGDNGLVRSGAHVDNICPSHLRHQHKWSKPLQTARVIATTTIFVRTYECGIYHMVCMCVAYVCCKLVRMQRVAFRAFLLQRGKRHDNTIKACVYS